MLKRTRPHPIPTITAVPEYLVDGARKALYDDTKRVLQVPWMGVVTMALAHYREFYEVLWRAVGPMLGCAEAANACRSLRREVEQAVFGLSPPPRRDALAAMGYAPREIAAIKETIEVFSHGNFYYALLATLTRLALERDAWPSERGGSSSPKSDAPDVQVPFVLMEEHHADEQTRAVYAAIRDTLGLPFVNTDYRALARWPSYFRLVWADLAPMVEAPAYADIVTRLHARLIEESLNLPNPTGIETEALRNAAERAASVDEILRVAQLFQWLLPGLIVNVAFFRTQLEDIG